MSMPYLMILTIIGWGVGSFCYKVANDSMHPFMISVIVTAVYIIEQPILFSVFKFDKTVTTSGVIATVIGAASMAIGSLAYFFALKKGGAGEITATSAVYPAVTLLLSMFFTGEEMTWRKGIGMVLALASVAMFSLK